MTEPDQNPGALSLVVIGGGLCGLLTGMLLADDGHRVTVLERDEAEPPDPSEAWDGWDRSSIRQFHMGHFFLPRFRAELDRHLPRVSAAIDAAGGLRVNPVAGMPAELSGGLQPGDERFETLTGRRPVVEAVVARCAAQTDGLDVRRGVTVRALLRGNGPDAPVDVVGVKTDDGQSIPADLVIDASGRNSALPRLLTEAGAPAPVDESDDSGFVYYGRSYRSADGSVPVALGGALQHYGTISTLTLAADNGTWQLALVASGRDAAMRRARDPEVFDRLWRSFPLVAHWIDGEPISDIEMMANLEDRIRHFVVDGAPVATGVVAVGDSWACTNPSVGRGASMAMIHAVALRDHLRATADLDAVEAALAWDRRTGDSVEPYYRDTVRADRHRLGEIEAELAGETYRSDDPAYRFQSALPGAAFTDPELLRAWLDNVMLHRLLDDIMGDERLVARVVEQGADAEPAPGLSRSELEAVIAGG